MRKSANPRRRPTPADGGPDLKDLRDPWYNTVKAARFLRLTVHSMAQYRTVGNGPYFYRIGNRVVYHRDDLIAWRTEERRGRPAGVRDSVKRKSRAKKTT